MSIIAFSIRCRSCLSPTLKYWERSASVKSWIPSSRTISYMGKFSCFFVLESFSVIHFGWCVDYRFRIYLSISCGSDYMCVILLRDCQTNDSMRFDLETRSEFVIMACTALRCSFGIGLFTNGRTIGGY
jgi:hypothetical protein